MEISMNHKSVFTWTFLLCKHILKLPIIPIMLLLIPAFTIIVQALPKESTDSGVTIGVYFESDDELSCGMRDKLLVNDTAFSFISYDSSDSLINDVLLGKLECGYVFDSEFSPKIQKGKYDEAIMVIQSPSTLFRSASNEIVFSSLIQLSGYDILGKYVDIEEIPVSQREEAKASLFASYDAYCSFSHSRTA